MLQLSTQFQPSFSNLYKTDLRYETNENSQSATKLENPHINALQSYLGQPDIEVEQDQVNPHIFTVRDEGKKSYWFLNVLTQQYHLLAEYRAPVNNNEGAEAAVELGSGVENMVYSRNGVAELAIRTLHGKSAIPFSELLQNTNLMLSLLYSMDGYEEILKSINLGFIKSSHPFGFKTILPAVQGGTLTQMFGTEGPNEICYKECYGLVSREQKAIVETAKRKYAEDIQEGASLVEKLNKHYREFCQHAEGMGYLITHYDLRPYNVMYDSINRCLTLIDGDSWCVFNNTDMVTVAQKRTEADFHIIEAYQNKKF